MDFQLTVEIDNESLRYFAKNGMKLCTAFGFSTSASGEIYNVLATADSPTSSNTVTWSPTYQVSACNISMQPRQRVAPNYTPVDVVKGQMVTLPEDGVVIQAATFSSDAPADGFLLLAKPSAVGVLLQTVRFGAPKPVFITEVGDMLPPSDTRQKFIPDGPAANGIGPAMHNGPTVAVFFMRDQEQGTVFSFGKDRFSAAFVLRYGDHPESVVTYTKGAWTYVNFKTGQGDIPASNGRLGKYILHGGVEQDWTIIPPGVDIVGNE